MKQKDILNELGVSRTTLWKWRVSGEFPEPIIKCGFMIGWLTVDIQEWLINNES
jgi:prophage regulatory protein